MEKLILKITNNGTRNQVQVSLTKLVEPLKFDFESPSETIPTIGQLSPQDSHLREIGAELFSSVFRGKVEEIYRTILENARKTSEGLALYLVLDECNANLPWELAFDEQNPPVFLTKILPGKNAVKTIRFYHDNPHSYLSGIVLSDSEWLLVNGEESDRFENHTEDGPKNINLTIKTSSLLLTDSLSKSTRRAKVIFQLDQEYTGSDKPQRIEVPVIISLEPMPFYLAFIIPVALSILILVPTILGLFSAFGAFWGFLMSIASLPIVVAIIFFFHKKIFVRIVDVLQRV